MNFLLGLKTPEDSYPQHFHKQWNFGETLKEKITAWYVEF